jgi:transporter family-2 protein
LSSRAPAGLAFAGGAVFALQTRVNGELASESGSAVWAALVSFGSGLVLVAALVLAVPRTRAALVRGARDRLPWWTYTGGLSGAFLVVVSALAVPRVGVATFTVGVVAGQALGGLLIDRVGLGPGGVKPLSPTRVAGALIAVAAVALIRFDHSGGGTSGGVVLALLLAAAGGGVWLSLQQALNGRVQRATGQPLVAALVNFVVGTTALVVVFAITAAAGDAPGSPWPGTAWLYVGGALGVVYISTAAWAVRPLGVLRLGLLTVAGQLAGGVLIDLIGPAEGTSVGPITVAAVLLTLLGVAVAGIQSRSRRRTSSTESAANPAR